MKVHVAVTGEPDRAYVNMILLLLYSLRQNGGALSEAPVTVVTNGAEVSEASRREIERFGSVTYRVMPRQHGGEGFVNKFNALYAPLEDYDILLFLDCDTAVFKPLDDLVAGMNPEKAQFRARVIGEPGGQKAGQVEMLIQRYALSEGGSLAHVADERFPRGYPLFNAGVMAMTRPAVKRIRRDALRIACELYAERARTTQASVMEMVKEAGRRMWGRLVPNASQTPHAFWITDQLGIALSLIKHDVEYEILPPYFNWVHPHGPSDRELPALFHYMSGRHSDINRERLFEGAWIERYLDNNEGAPRQALARLAQEYASERS